MVSKYLTEPAGGAPAFRCDPGLPCARHPAEWWWPERTMTSENELAVRLCQRVCSRRDDCLRWALEKHQEFGIYGGLTPRERRKLMRDRQGRRS